MDANFEEGFLLGAADGSRESDGSFSKVRLFKSVKADIKTGSYRQVNDTKSSSVLQTSWNGM